MDILYVTLYPLHPLKHGGMIRAARIHEHLKCYGDVHLVSFFCPAHHPGYVKKGFQFLIEHSRYDDMVIKEGKRPDIYLPELIDNNQKKKLRSYFNKLKPQVVIFEQPWGWPIFKDILGSSSFKPRIIYSSQNYELDLAEDRDKYKVNEIEVDLVQSSDAIVCVTSKDKDRYEELGGKKIVVCPNGADPFPNVSEYQIEYHYWSERFKDKRVAVFVASAHQPNVDGFINLVGPVLGYLPPDTIIVVIGEVHRLIENSYKFRVYRSINMERLCFTGVVDDKNMNALLSLAEVVLVPMTTGGGSNLKVAQALVSGKKIVTTSYGLRGFEEYMNTPLVSVADDEFNFKSFIVSMLSENVSSDNEINDSTVDYSSLYWDNNLSLLKILF